MMDKRIKAYMNAVDVEEMYIKLNCGSRKGLNSFMVKAKQLAEKNSRGYYIFKREDDLFELFKAEIPEKLEKRRFTTWGDLVQYVS